MERKLGTPRSGVTLKSASSFSTRSLDIGWDGGLRLSVDHRLQHRLGLNAVQFHRLHQRLGFLASHVDLAAAQSNSAPDIPPTEPNVEEGGKGLKGVCRVMEEDGSM